MAVCAVPKLAVRMPVVVVTETVDAALPGMTVQNGALVNA
jgi:hypothetical protein